jgi:hypothetical protein
VAKSSESSSKIDAVYDYTDESGKLIFQVVRFLPKDFRQRRPDGFGSWIWSTKGIEKPIYNLHKAATTEQVWLFEGEKDALIGEKTRLPGACSTLPGGAGKRFQDQWAAQLNGRRVIIVPDNDKPGHEHAAKVAQELKSRGHRGGIALALVPEFHKDYADWIAADPEQAARISETDFDPAALWLLNGEQEKESKEKDEILGGVLAALLEKLIIPIGDQGQLLPDETRVLNQRNQASAKPNRLIRRLLKEAGCKDSLIQNLTAEVRKLAEDAIDVRNVQHKCRIFHGPILFEGKYYTYSNFAAGIVIIQADRLITQAQALQVREDWQSFKELLEILDDYWPRLVASVLATLINANPNSKHGLLISGFSSTGKTTVATGVQRIIGDARIKLSPQDLGDSWPAYLSARAPVIDNVDDYKLLKRETIHDICALLTSESLFVKERYSRSGTNKPSGYPIITTIIPDLFDRIPTAKNRFVQITTTVNSLAESLSEQEIAARWENARPHFFWLAERFLEDAPELPAKPYGLRITGFSQALLWICVHILNWEQKQIDAYFEQLKQELLGGGDAAPIQIAIEQVAEILLKGHEEWRGKSKDLVDMIREFADPDVIDDLRLADKQPWQTLNGLLRKLTQGRIGNYLVQSVYVSDRRKRGWLIKRTDQSRPERPLVSLVSAPRFSASTLGCPLVLPPFLEHSYSEDLFGSTAEAEIGKKQFPEKTKETKGHPCVEHENHGAKPWGNQGNQGAKSAPNSQKDQESPTAERGTKPGKASKQEKGELTINEVRFIDRKIDEWTN